MKALPLWQPWATLVAIGAKKVETRSWPLMCEEYFLDTLAEHFRLDPELPATTDLVMGKLSRGAIVATARLARAAEVTERSAATLLERNPREHAFGNYAPGRFAWVLEDAQPVDPPLRCQGRQGIFDAPLELAARDSRPGQTVLEFA